jgi:hypothetical protein
MVVVAPRSASERTFGNASEVAHVVHALSFLPRRGLGSSDIDA